MQDHQSCSQISLIACTEARKRPALVLSSASKLHSSRVSPEQALASCRAPRGWPYRLWCLPSTQGRLLSRHSGAQSCSLRCARLLVKPRACTSMPACDSGSWSPSCWHRECFLPTTTASPICIVPPMDFHAGCWHLPVPAGFSSLLGRQMSPAGCPLSQHPWLCLAASLPSESSCWSLALLGAGWATALQSDFACWLHVCFPTIIWRRRLRLTTQP